MICLGCGGVVGRDCWNPVECKWIHDGMAMRAAQPPQPEPCQGCHCITGQMVTCLGICDGMASQEDADARAAVWASFPTIHANDGGHS